MKNGYFVVLIIGISSIQFFVTNRFFEGSLDSKQSLAREIRTNSDSLDQYKLVSEVPFKFRVLFPAIVKSSVAVLNGGDRNSTFYRVYLFWSLIFYVASTIAFFFLLTSIHFKPAWSFAGVLFFLLQPPMLLAFTVPVHTREDTLAYLILFLGLTFLVNNQRLLFLTISIVGVFCRETLLLLPLLYLVFSKDRLQGRVLFFLIPVCIWLAFRVMMWEPYDAMEGLKWNWDNPAQVMGFLFITFNILWIPFGISILRPKKKDVLVYPEQRFFYRSAVFTIVVLLVTTYLGGIFNEIRLLYLFSPWIIIVTLNYLATNNLELKKIIWSTRYVSFIVVSFVVFSILIYLFLSHWEKIYEAGKFDVPYHIWIVFSSIYLFLFIVLLPAFLKNGLTSDLTIEAHED